MNYTGYFDDFWSVPTRSSLTEFRHTGLNVVRSCYFSFAAKILSPIDDILVPLVTDRALDDLVARPGISGVITTPDLAILIPEALGLAIADDPMRAHHEVHCALARMPGRLWRDFPSDIHPSAEIHQTAWVAPRNVRIAANVVILPGAIVCERSRIGASTRIHSRAVVASDAYEIIMLDDRQILRPQTGGVAIGERCEISAGSVITRSAFGGATAIGDGTILDANVVISHDCRIGRDVRIGGGSWIGGRVNVGDYASLGPNSTIGNGLTVGDRAKVALGSVVTRSVVSGQHVSGNFAIDHARTIEHIRRIR